MNDLILFDHQVNSLAVFTDKEKVDEILLSIREKATSFVPDVSTIAGRKQIASVAFKVSKSKIMLDEAGKNLVAEWKVKAKKVDASRKEMREYLQALRIEVREPLVKWEKQEAIRKAKIREEAKRNTDWDEAIKLNDLFNQRRDLERREAIVRQREEKAEAKRLAEIERKAEIERQLKLKEEEEARQREAERVRKAHEDQLKKEAREKAQQEAEAKAKVEREEAAQLLQKERLAKEKAEREKIAAEERAKIEKEMAIQEVLKEAERKKETELEAIREANLQKALHEQEKQDAINRKAAEDQEQSRQIALAAVKARKIIEERNKTNALKQQMKEKEAKRLSEDKEHRIQINHKVLQVLIDKDIPKDIARQVVLMVSRKQVPFLVIQY